jgi:predicted nuclease with TOPRIM domain
MSDGEHNGIRGKVEAFARNELATGLNRLVVMVGLPLMAFLGLQVWSDIKEGQAEAKQGNRELREEIAELSDKVGDMKADQSVTEVRLDGLERRVDKLEAPRDKP